MARWWVGTVGGAEAGREGWSEAENMEIHCIHFPSPPPPPLGLSGKETERALELQDAAINGQHPPSVKIYFLRSRCVPWMALDPGVHQWVNRAGVTDTVPRNSGMVGSTGSRSDQRCPVIPSPAPPLECRAQGLSSSRFFFSRSCLAGRAQAVQQIPSDAVLSSLDSRA